MIQTITKKVTIASGAQLSTACECQGLMLVAIQFTAFTGTALTFHGNVDNFDGTYVEILESGAGGAVTWVVAANKIVVPAGSTALIAGLCGLKIRSGSSEGGDRIVTLHFVNTNPAI